MSERIDTWPVWVDPMCCVSDDCGCDDGSTGWIFEEGTQVTLAEIRDAIADHIRAHGTTEAP